MYLTEINISNDWISQIPILLIFEDVVNITDNKVMAWNEIVDMLPLHERRQVPKIHSGFDREHWVKCPTLVGGPA